MGEKHLQRSRNILYLNKTKLSSYLVSRRPSCSKYSVLTNPDTLTSFLFSPGVSSMVKQLLAFPLELQEQPRGLTGDASPYSIPSDAAATAEIQSRVKVPSDAIRKWEVC